MGLGKTLLLGFTAGATILLGLPIGRIRRPAVNLRLLLNATAVGVLIFLIWDVLSAAWEPIDAELSAIHDGGGSLGKTVGYGVLFAAGLSIGLLSLVAYERWMTGRMLRTPRPAGPGTMSVGELDRAPTDGWSPARHLALLIAVGIGLHNFAEGLAIGQSAA